MRNSVRLIFLGLVAIAFALSFQTGSSAQKRDAFSHNTAAHKKKDCNSCHQMPTSNWVPARGYPDVARFPGHAACSSCHTASSLLGACNACHTSSSPRSAPLRPFPVRSRSHEFGTIFPHNAHQDIIASNNPYKRNSDVAVAHFINASFTPVADDPPQFNNCAICHVTPDKLPKNSARTLLTSVKPLTTAVPDIFETGKEVSAKFFKDSPVNHASCFTCHYQGVKPVASNCAGCHSLTRPYSEPNITARYSLKFNHQTENHAGKDCVFCHVRITQNGDVRAMKDADVPLLTCSTSSCHGDTTILPRTNPKYPISAIQNEIAAREDGIKANKPVFQCSYCHTSAVGRYEIPASHFKP